MSFPILHLCARIRGNDLQRRKLQQLCLEFSCWEDLLYEAEKHGMGPLLYHHLKDLEIKLPHLFLRNLYFLYLRHQEANRIILGCLEDICHLFRREKIDSMVLKGGALSNTLYPHRGLRPMRDIDLFLPPDTIDQAFTLLRDNGFNVSDEPLQENYFHLPGLIKGIEGMSVCVELHHGLYPALPPYYGPVDFSTSFETAQSFTVGEEKAWCLGPEEMLQHLFFHGIRAPLTYEPYRLISVADIVSFARAKSATINWDTLRLTCPVLCNALPYLYDLTSCNDEKNTPVYKTHQVKRVGEPYAGWPRNTFLGKNKKPWWKLLRQTFLPSPWWMRVYYGTGSRSGAIKHQLLSHPLHILRWIKAYVVALLKKPPR